MNGPELNTDKIYTYADYYKWNDGKRYELIFGKVYEMLPSPSAIHQRVSGNIFNIIKNYLNKSKKCEIFHAPFDVRLPKIKDDIDDNNIYTVVQPDIVVVCDPKKIDEKGCLGAPDLIVEILSPFTAKKDVKDKFLLYQNAGVIEYWLISPKEGTLTVFKLNKKGKYSFSQIYSNVDKVKVGIFKDLVIDLSEVFVPARED